LSSTAAGSCSTLVSVVDSAGDAAATVEDCGSGVVVGAAGLVVVLLLASWLVDCEELSVGVLVPLVFGDSSKRCSIVISSCLKQVVVVMCSFTFRP